MNKLLVVLLVFMATGYANADEADFRCLKSIGLKKPIRLQFTFPADGKDTGYVIYQNGNGKIPVKRLKEKELRQGPVGRPSEFEISWVEITAKGYGGRYVFFAQGAILDDFRYIRKNGKVFKFEEDADAEGDNGCEWHSQSGSSRTR